MEYPVEPDEPYKRGLYYLPLDVPPRTTVTVRDTVPGLKDGPCLLLFLEQEMPLIDELDRVTKYAIGIAMRLIAFNFDLKSVAPSAALRIYGELAEAANAVMERYRRGECGPFSVDHLVEALERITGDLFADIDIRQQIHAYIHYALTAQPSPNDGPIPLGEVVADSRITEECAALIGRVPTFHIEADVFDQCEVPGWRAAKFTNRILPSDAFLIAVDGETWLPIQNTFSNAQDDWILVDARRSVWYLYEKVRIRGLDVRSSFAQIVGSTFNTETNQVDSIASTSVFTEDAGSFKPFKWPTKEANRVLQAAITFMFLLTNSRVTVEPTQLVGHWNVRLPPGSTVDELVDEVLEYDDQKSA